jgi:hypothetical protein
MENKSKIKLIIGVDVKYLGLISIHPSHQLEWVQYITVHPFQFQYKRHVLAIISIRINPSFKLINEIRSPAIVIGR